MLIIKVRDCKEMTNGESKIIETTVGRVIFNQVVPEEYGYINELLDKEITSDIIGDILKKTGYGKNCQVPG